MSTDPFCSRWSRTVPEPADVGAAGCGPQISSRRCIVLNNVQYRNVSMQFSGKVRGGIQETLAIDDISFRVNDGEFLVIVGPSGCGKSTLLHLTSGLLLPTCGNISLGGDRITGPGPDKAIVFQNFSLFPWKTVRENIEFGL